GWLLSLIAIGVFFIVMAYTKQTGPILAPQAGTRSSKRSEESDPHSGEERKKKKNDPCMRRYVLPLYQ
ncbi:unnamed protein product, partial [Ilex paraguariensis]